jgi:hypothetical protein
MEKLDIGDRNGILAQVRADAARHGPDFLAGLGAFQQRFRHDPLRQQAFELGAIGLRLFQRIKGGVEGFVEQLARHAQLEGTVGKGLDRRHMKIWWSTGPSTVYGKLAVSGVVYHTSAVV